MFVTLRLYNSLLLHRAFPFSGVTSGQYFATMDRLLDQALCGSTFLRQPAIAEEVLRSIETGAELGRYRMHAWVIMPNHVHLSITPTIT
jgi:REP-associated tyrosine transposase